MRIGIITSKYYTDHKKIKELIALIQNHFGKHNATIISPAHSNADIIVKKYALEMTLDYIEFNPAYTGYNLYSFEKKEYYEGKNWHFSQLIHRFNRMFQNVDKIFIFTHANKEHDSMINDIISKIPKKIPIQKII
jgi:hypothetical protein